MNVTRIITLLSAIIMVTPALADNACKVIHWQPDHIYTIKGEINHAVHVIFPVAKAADPVVGNQQLWTVEAQANHVFLKPNDVTTPDGKSTTLTFLGANQQSYEFTLQRVTTGADNCVVIKTDGKLMDASWKKLQTPNQHLTQLLESQLSHRKQADAEKAKAIIAQQRKALNAYRSHIYSNYTWEQHGGWWEKKAINSVYDDGRWTYIRLNSDNKGIMSVSGMINGHKELLQYKYDATNKVYRIAGIYPKLILSYDKNTITVTRHH